jgi:SSS family solute:Na+ symporter
MNKAGQHLAFLILGPYLLAVLAIGFFFRHRAAANSSAFLHARGALPVTISSLAFIAANCGAIEIVGMVAASAKYGMAALHFYWIGAIPAMIFLALYMLPIYRHSRAVTVPDFLRLRYNNATHILSASCQAAMMSLVSGIGLYAISFVLHIFFGWDFFRLMVVVSSVVLCYILFGGIRATLYNEVLQFALTIAGLFPLTVMVLHDFHGIGGIRARLPGAMDHVWTTLPFYRPHIATLDITGVVFGLGIVLSFGYWCTDFLLIQRALTARSAQGAMRTPLVAAVFKLCFPALLVIPGLAAAVLFHPDTMPRYDQALPLLLRHYYGPALLGLGLSAIVSSLMSGLAGNISALSALWTHDLYRTYLRPSLSDRHYLWMGRFSALAAVLISLAAALIALRFDNLMDYLMLVFSLFNAPLFAAFLCGMFSRWATPAAGFCGLLAGVTVGLAHNIAVHTHTIVYGSDLLASFYGAICAFSACLITIVFVSMFTQRKGLEALAGLTYYTTPRDSNAITPSMWIFSGCLLSACIVLNLIFR